MSKGCLALAITFADQYTSGKSAPGPFTDLCSHVEHGLRRGIRWAGPVRMMHVQVHPLVALEPGQKF
ncbi:MAG: hypothetical protein ACT4O4_13110, partial [Nitrospiraceae bacterium]